MPCQTISQGSSHSKLEGVYNRRQPGSSPHPALKHRQQQRNELRRSASLVLAKNQRGGCDAMDGPLPPFADWVVDPSRHTRSTTPAQDKSRANWSTPQRGSALLEDLPPRLEDCLQRLAQADRELEFARAQQAYIASSPTHYRVVRAEEPKPASPKRQSSSGVKDEGDGPATSPEPLSRGSSSQQLGKAKPGTPQQPDNKPFSSGSVGIGEPAPEPPMASNMSFSGLDIPPDADFDDGFGDASDKEGDQLSGGPSVIGEDLTGKIEEHLMELDRKWQAVDQERLAAQRQRDELAGRLSATEAREESLGSQLRTLDAKLQEANSSIQALRKSLGVSEESAQALRARVGELEKREDELRTQANQLTEELCESKSQVDHLTAKLAETETSRDQIRERGNEEREVLTEKVRRAERDEEASTKRAEAAEKALEEARAALDDERQGREQDKVTAANEAKKRSEEERSRQDADSMQRTETEKQRSAEDTRKHADLDAERHRLEERAAALEKELLAANERTRAAEQELAKVRQERNDGSMEAETKQEHAQAPAFENEQTLDIFSMEAMGMPTLAAIPSLLFAANLPPGSQAGDGSASQELPALLPTQCMVDLMSSEIRLQTLAPSGPLRKIGLRTIDSITRPESPRGTVDLEFAGEPHMLQKLRLRAVDEQGASALIAAISMPNRIMPGGVLGSPPGEEAQGQ